MVISLDICALEPNVPKFLAHLGSVAKSDIGWRAVLIPTAKYSSFAISANSLTISGLLVAANPNCDGHFENPSTEKDATPPPFGISWMGSELIVIGIPVLFWMLPFENY